jgi:hypothetical protein
MAANLQSERKINLESDERITVRLEGAVEDDGHLRLSEFLNQLEALRAALKQTERIITGAEESRLYYRIVDVSHSSPLTVVLEPTPIKPDGDTRVAKTTVKKFITTLRLIEKKKDAPQDFDLTALEAYKGLGAMLEKHVSGLTIASPKRSVTIDKQFKSRVNDIIGPDELVEGSITGTLEWINLHNMNRFNIYPVIGPKKVLCDFPRKLREKVKSAIDRHVEVFGELKYKRWGNFPYAMNVTDLEILPPDDELPTLFDLRGVAPNATGGVNSAEFVRALRDEGW